MYLEHWSTNYLLVNKNQFSNCWIFLQYVWKKEFGFTVLDIDVTWGDGVISVIKTFKHHPEYVYWHKINGVENYKDGDAVVLSNSGHALGVHIGLWVADINSILHFVSNQGSKLTNKTNIEQEGYKIINVYRHKTLLK